MNNNLKTLWKSIHEYFSDYNPIPISPMSMALSNFEAELKQMIEVFEQYPEDLVSTNLLKEILGEKK